MTLLVKPSVELLDEPMTGVDPCSRRGFIQMMNELKKSEGATLMTTHRMEDAE